jgi:hypothetical protein
VQEKGTGGIRAEIDFSGWGDRRKRKTVDDPVPRDVVFQTKKNIPVAKASTLIPPQVAHTLHEPGRAGCSCKRRLAK